MDNSFKKFNITFILFLNFILIVSWLLPYFLINQLPARMTREYTSKDNLFFNIRDLDLDLLMIGDSSLLRGVKTHTLEKKTNKKIFSLTLNANSGLRSYKLLLKKFLENNKKPKKIIFYFAPQTLSRDQHTMERTYTLTRHDNIFNLLLSGVTSIDLIKTFKIVKYGKDNVSSDYSNLILYQRGYAASYDETRQDINRIYDLSYKKIISNKQISKLKNLLDYSRSLGIKTYLYIAPSPEGDKSVLYYRKVYSDLADNEIVTYPTNFFRDIIHLLDDSANIHTLNFEKNFINKVVLQN